MSKYEAIYKDILGRIEQNLYATGDTLPGEYELMKIYEASRDTIRKALLLLAQNGYIQKSKGRGSIVLDRQRYDFPVSGVVSFKELADKMEQDVQTKVICLEKTHPDARIRQLFHMSPEDEIWLVQRVRIIDHEAVILDTDILDASIIPELNEEILEQSLYSYIEETLHLKIAYAEKEITCQNVSGLDTKVLDMKQYDMVVNVESCSYLDDARIFQYTNARHRPDKFRFKDFARRVKLA